MEHNNVIISFPQDKNNKYEFYFHFAFTISKYVLHDVKENNLIDLFSTEYRIRYGGGGGGV